VHSFKTLTAAVVQTSDLVITAGGDGTFLAAAKHAVDSTRVMVVGSPFFALKKFL
jgi:NAD kinase